MRLVAATLLLAALARGEGVLVRVALGDEPVAGAGVKALGPEEALVFDTFAWAPDARTDESGQAVVDVPRGGRVVVVQPGFALAEAPAESALVDVALRPELVFQGRLVATDGTAVANADVSLRTTARRKATLRVRSREDGRFFVYGLWLDDYALYVSAAGFLPLEAADLTEADTRKSYTLTRPARVAGRLVDGAGHEVDLVRGMVAIDRVKADGDGRFVFERVTFTDASCRVRLAAPFGGESPPFEIVPEGRVADLEIAVLAPATVRVQVVDEQRAPLPGVEGRLDGTELVTDARGVATAALPPRRETSLHLAAPGLHPAYVSVGSVEPGRVRDVGTVVLRPVRQVEIRVRLPDGTLAPQGKVGEKALADGTVTLPEGWYPVEVAGYPDVNVRAEPPGPVDLVLAEPRWLEGVVLTADGAPVAGALVQAFSLRTTLEVASDAEGRFRVGPWHGDEEGLSGAGVVTVTARTAAAESGPHEAVLGEGVLEVRLRDRRLDLLRGLVLRGDRPVTRFSLLGTDWIDEEGRFELLVDRARRSHVELLVDERWFAFALPPEGETLIARLPAGTLDVRLPGVPAGHAVELRGLGRSLRAVTGEDGLARFLDLAPGLYVADAPGFAPREIAYDGQGAPVVPLEAVVRGTLRLRTREGEVVKELDPGVHARVYDRGGVRVESVRIEAGGETFVDLDLPGAGTAVLTGPAHTDLAVLVRLPDAVLVYAASLDEYGAERLVLPPGTHELRSGGARRAVVVPAGGEVRVELTSVGREVAGRAVTADGRPAQGASVELVTEGGDAVGSEATDLLGRFRFAEVPPGEYACVAELAGHAPAETSVTVSTGGVVAAFPLVLAPGARGWATLLGAAGEPAARVGVLVDGRRQGTDSLGRFRLDRVPARLDLDLTGYASLRGLEVRDGDVVRLERGPRLVVLCAPGAEARLSVLVRGRPWEPLAEPGLPGRAPVPGRLELPDLPVGPVEVRLAPEGDGEPVRREIRLRSGIETVLDLREG